MFRLGFNNFAKAKALSLENFTCQVIGIIYEVEEFWSHISIQLPKFQVTPPKTINVHKIVSSAVGRLSEKLGAKDLERETGNSKRRNGEQRTRNGE